MTTQLTNNGWINANNESFLWTNQADEVNEGDDILVDAGVVANTLGGKDSIIGTGFDGIANDGTINTGKDSDTITGTGDQIGIDNADGIIETRGGNDSITGIGSSVGIATGAGLIANGTINTGKGNDSITGTGFFVGISNASTINTGKGSDTITGISTASTGGFGIANGGTINTGKGNDTVDASDGGFNGGGTINLGQGKDLIRGFGEQSVFGGQGMDTAELGINSGDELLSLGMSFDIKIGDMEFTDVETFVFNDGTFSLEDLQGIVI